METTINQVGEVEYELDLHVTAEDLAPEIDQALRKQRAQTHMKGFRPGKVPVALVKKMYGKALAYEIAEKTVQKTYEDEVLEGSEHEVLGQPTITKLEYEMDGDLRAVVHFGVRPHIELQDLSGETLSRLVHDISEEEIDEEIEKLRKREADLVPVEEEGAGETDQVVVDLQTLDEESGTPVIGQKEEDATFFLDDEGVQPELKDALLGLKTGDTARVTLAHGSGDHVHTHLYEVEVKEVKRRDLPELDDEFVKELTNDEVEDVAAFRENMKKQLTDAWKRQSDNLFEGQVIERMLALHDAPVPASAVDVYLDAFVEDFKQKSGGTLPDHFDENAFRQGSYGEAQRQARWMLVRDAFIKQEEIEVTEEDLDAHFEELSGNNEELSPALFRQYYQSLNMMDSVRQQILSRKVFEALSEKFIVEEKDREAYDREMEERRKQQAAEAQAAQEAEATGEAEPEQEAGPEETEA